MLQLGDILVSEGLLTDQQLTQALKASKSKNLLLGTYLTKNNLITEEDLITALSVQSELEIVNLSKIDHLDSLSTILKLDVCKRYMLVPFKRDNKAIHIAVSDPYLYKEIDVIRRLTGKAIEIYLAPKQDILTFMNKIYTETQEEDNVSTLHKKELELRSHTDKGQKNVSTDDIIANDALVKLLTNTIEKAIEKNSSDIHIDPAKDGVAIRFRVDGILKNEATISSILLDNLVRLIKVKSNLDFAQSRIPQDGRFSIINSLGREIDIRVSILPTLYGEKCTMRLLDKEKEVPDLDKLALLDDDIEKIRRMINKPFGLILVCGPTGSGKSTTVSSILNEVKSEEKNLMTLEDPIEYVIDGVNQSNINTKIGYTFESGLRTILRQDPDTIMIGEIRDEATAKIAVKAAITGHLVFSTLHTNDSIGAVTRLHEMGIEGFNISSALLGVVSQRLIRKVCRCSATTKSMTTELETRMLESAEEVEVVHANGCPLCNKGYKGRIPMIECLEVDNEMRNIIARNGSENEILVQARKSGFRTLKENAIERIKRQETTIEELTRVLGSLITE